MKWSQTVWVGWAREAMQLDETLTSNNIRRRMFDIDWNSREQKNKGHKVRSSVPTSGELSAALSRSEHFEKVQIKTRHFAWRRIS